MKFDFEHRGQIYTLELQTHGEQLHAVIDGRLYEVSVVRGQPLELALDGQRVQAAWAKDGREIWLHMDGHSYVLRRAAGRRSGGQAAGGERSLRAPMPGQVRKVLVQPGQQVAAGTVLVLLEAMKMEVRISAGQDAKVAQVAVSEGQSVEKDQVLVELEAEHGG